MIKLHAGALASLVCFSLGSTAFASSIRQQRTDMDEAQALCQPDVFRLCNDAVPDEDRIIACMTANRKSLSPECRKIFDVGIKNRVQ